MIKEPEVDCLFQKSRDSIFPSEITHDEYKIVSVWRVLELLNGEKINFTLESNDDKVSCPDFDFLDYDDVKFLITESINNENINELLSADKFRRMTIFGKIVGRDVNNWGSELDRNYFLVNDIYVNGWWLEYDQIKSTCDKLDLRMVPNLGRYRVDVEEFQRIYDEQLPKTLIQQICKNLMHGVTEFDEGIRSLSKFAEEEGIYRPAHGIRAIAEPQLLDKQNNRVQFQLKTSDLRNLYEGNAQYGYE